MNNIIGGYRRLTAMQTTGSGTARWCLAMQGTKRYFLKEFLSPVYPANPCTQIGQRQLDRCKRFENRKQRLYTAASCVIGDVLVPVVDFFRENGHYYAVSEAVPDGHMTADHAATLREQDKKKLLYELSAALQRMHSQGIVHADLKPEHVLILPREDRWSPHLIDLDSGFLLEDPPKTEQELEGDPAYLAPEVFLCMAGAEYELGTQLDMFAFGALIHQIWSGSLPGFDHKCYHYLYEAALAGAEIQLELPDEWEETVRRMLSPKPEERPSAAAVAAMFSDKHAQAASLPVQNGLKRLMKV